MVFALILLVLSISALQVLGIKAISDPATQMLSLILDAIPLILVAGILMAIGVVAARFAGGLLERFVGATGLDGALRELGLTADQRNIGRLVARVAQVAIVLFFAVAATRLLNFPEITAMLDAVLTLGGRILVGAAVIAVGVYIAGLMARTVSSGRSQELIRYAAIALFVAMGLTFMGIADSIVNLAFGAIVVGAAAAAALAFGLGGRDAAARQLSRWHSPNSSD